MLLGSTDIFFSLEASSLEEAVSDNICEGVSKEEKEKAQRAINKKELSVFFQLKKWLDKRWNKKITKKEDFIRKRIEYSHFLQIMKAARANAEIYSSKEAKEYIRDVLGAKLDWITSINNSSDSGNIFLRDVSKINPLTKKPYKTDEDSFININTNSPAISFKFSEEQQKKLAKQIKQYIILHEYGHLFDYLKKAVIFEPYKVGDTNYLLRTGVINFDRPEAKKARETLKKSEGVAEAYALDNIYRKDRREMLKNSNKHKDALDIPDLDEKIKKQGGVLPSDFYTYGGIENSKTAKKTLESIELERANKSTKMIQIYVWINEILNKLKKQGKKIPKITALVVKEFPKIPSKTKIYIPLNELKNYNKNKVVKEINKILENYNGRNNI